MKYEILQLKDVFPAFGENGCDATLTTYLPGNLSEINREHEKHPCLLICPGGGYEFAVNESRNLSRSTSFRMASMFLFSITLLHRIDIRRSLEKWQRQWN